MSNLDNFFNTQSVEKVFTFKGRKFSENVAKYPKILYVRDFSSSNSGSLYPESKSNIFSLRIDVDEFDEKDFGEYIEILKPFSKLVTLFCCCSAFIGKEYLLKELKSCGFDVQSHGYYHYAYNDYENNYNNIAKAKDFFKRLDINTKGFAAPMGKYNNNLMRALEDLNYIYSSDFSFDYLNFPHFPKLKDKFSKILQVPVFPVCPELLFLHGFSLDEVISYYDMVISVLEESGAPLIIYAHTDKRYPKVKDFLKQILAKISRNDKLYKSNISDFVDFCLKSEDKEFSKGTGLLNSKISSGLKSPDNSLLGVPAVLSPLKSVKRAIKNLIDFETVTPVKELKGNKIKKSLKIFFRNFREEEI